MKGNTWIQKVAGLAAAAIVSYSAQKFGLHLSETEVAGLIVTVFTFVELAVAKRTNPGNAASAHLAAKEKVEVHEIKAAEQ